MQSRDELHTTFGIGTLPQCRVDGKPTWIL